MRKTILLTGGTDGIGFETAKLLVKEGHTLLLHGRNADKLARAKTELDALTTDGAVSTYRADLSDLHEVRTLAAEVTANHTHLDVLINNAGIFKTPAATNHQGYDIRFIVNTVAPYLLTTELKPLFSPESRVVNLSSAAQAPVDLAGLTAKAKFTDNAAYAQSKLGITMWSFHLAATYGASGPHIIAVNPASFLGSKMVKEAYGTKGHNLSIGAEILRDAALSDRFANASGRYFDNDAKAFANPHPDALNKQKNADLVSVIETLIHAV